MKRLIWLCESKQGIAAYSGSGREVWDKLGTSVYTQEHSQGTEGPRGARRPKEQIPLSGEDTRCIIKGTHAARPASLPATGALATRVCLTRSHDLATGSKSS